MSYNKTNKTEELISPENLHKLLEDIKSVQYGSLTLIIQDGRIIQIDKVEKNRLI